MRAKKLYQIQNYISKGHCRAAKQHSKS